MRNTPRTHRMLRVMALCMFTWLSWVSVARAQVFAPMCDEAGASAIAPLPVVAHARGEIRPGPCSPFDLLDRVDAASGEQEAPKVNLQAQPSFAVVELLKGHEVPPASLHRELEPETRSLLGAPYPSSVYRPPR